MKLSANTLKTRWIRFLSTILDPWTIALAFSLVGFSYLSSTAEDSLARALLVIMISIGSSVLGARVFKLWSAYSEQGVLRARGKSAVRGLNLMIRNTHALEERLKAFRDDNEDNSNNSVVVRRNLEEAIEFCRLLKEEGWSSVENWTDIVPEADIATRMGILSDLNQQIEANKEERDAIEEELKNLQSNSNHEREAFEKKVEQKEAKIRELNKELVEQSFGLQGAQGLMDAAISHAAGFDSNSVGSLGNVFLDAQSQIDDVTEQFAAAVKGNQLAVNPFLGKRDS